MLENENKEIVATDDEKVENTAIPAEVQEQPKNDGKNLEKFLTIDDYINGNKKLKDWVISLFEQNKPQASQSNEAEKNKKELPDF